MQVHQDNVWPERFGSRDRIGAVRCLGDDFEVGISAEQTSKPIPDHGMVVHDQHSDRSARPVIAHPVPFVTADGTFIEMAVPSPLTDSTCISPSTCSTRLRMAVSP